MASAIDSATPPVASGRLSYNMNSPNFSNLMKWMSKVKEDPDVKATLTLLHPCLSSNVQKILSEAIVFPELSKEDISKDPIKPLSLLVRPSFSFSDLHGFMSLLSDKIAEEKSTFAEIECLEFGVNLKTANDRVSLFLQMVRDISSFISEGLKFKKRDQLERCYHLKDNSPFLHLFEEIVMMILKSFDINEKTFYCISIPTSAVLSSVLFAKILEECKIEAVFEVLEDPRHGDETCVRTFTGKEVPMLVFSTADFDSAIDASINAAWFSEGLVSWATTAVLVQEGIYPKFITHFKNRLQKSAETVSVIYSRPNIEKDVEINVEKVLSEARKRDLEVFQVFPPKGRDTPATLVIGDFATIHLAGFSLLRKHTPLLLPILFVVPFRTVSEGISLANESSSKVAVSVWSESLSLCTSSTSRLNFGTIWLNSFGIFDVRIPVFSYGNVPEPVCATGLDYIHWAIKSRSWDCQRNVTFSSQDHKLTVDKLLTSAHNAHQSWNNCDVRSKIDIIDKIWSSSIKPSSFPTNLRQKLIKAVKCSFNLSFSIKVQNCIASSSVRPVGVIIFIANDPEKFSKVEDAVCLETILTPIFSGNAVIVISPFFHPLLSTLKLCLPEHLLSSFPQEMYAPELLNFLRKHKLGAEKVKVWTLLPSESTNLIIAEIVLEESCLVYEAPTIVEHSIKRKVVWQPIV